MHGLDGGSGVEAGVASAQLAERAEEPMQAPAPRRSYVRPVLRHLGSVRDLTLGRSAGFAEGAGTFIQPTM